MKPPPPASPVPSNPFTPFENPPPDPVEMSRPAPSAAAILLSLHAPDVQGPRACLLAAGCTTPARIADNSRPPPRKVSTLTSANRSTCPPASSASATPTAMSCSSVNPTDASLNAQVPTSTSAVERLENHGRSKDTDVQRRCVSAGTRAGATDRRRLLNRTTPCRRGSPGVDHLQQGHRLKTGVGVPELTKGLPRASNPHSVDA